MQDDFLSTMHPIIAMASICIILTRNEIIFKRNIMRNYLLSKDLQMIHCSVAQAADYLLLMHSTSNAIN